MTDIDKLNEMFSEIGLGDSDSRKRLTDKIKFDFDYSKKFNKSAQDIITTNHTKTEELCPTGTK